MSTDHVRGFLLPDPDARASGVWFYWKRGIRLKLAPFGTRLFAGRVVSILRAEAKSIGRPIPDSERRTIDDAELSAIASTVLVDWENMDHEHTGKPLEFTQANVIDQLVIRPGLYEFVVAQSKTLHGD